MGKNILFFYVCIILGFCFLTAHSAQNLEQEYNEKLNKLNRDLAKAHYSLGYSLEKVKMHDWANKEYKKAIKLDPDNSKARKRLGYKKDKAGNWETDPKVNVKKINHKRGKDALPLVKGKGKLLNSIGKKYSKKVLALAEWCRKKKLEKEAKEQYHRALYYSPNESKARKVLGHVKRKKGGWNTPFEQKIMQQSSKYLKTIKPGHKSKKKSKVENTMRIKFEKLESENFFFQSNHLSNKELATLSLHAEAALSLWSTLFKKVKPYGDEKMEYCILRSKQDHDNFIDKVTTGDAAMKAHSKKLSGWISWPLVEAYQGNNKLESMQEFVVHSTVESLQRKYVLTRRTQTHNPVWLLEGMALYFSRLMKNSNHWSCVSFHETGDDGGKIEPNDPKNWPIIIREIVLAERDTDLKILLNFTNHSDLGPTTSIKAWSVIDFLFNEHHEKFILFCEHLNEANDNGASSLKAIFNWSPEKADHEWRQYVRRAYVGR